jgi:hypothetical protein
VTPVQAVALAVELGLAAVQVIEAAKKIGCLVCDEPLQPADAPDLLQKSLGNRHDMAARAAGVDAASVRGLLRRDDVHLLTGTDVATYCGGKGLFTSDSTKMSCADCARVRAAEVYSG